MRFTTKITLAVSSIALATMTMGGLLIWDRLPSWELQRGYLLVELWTMGGVGIAVYFAIRAITRPLSELTELATQLGAGHLDRRLRVNSTKEMAILSKAFNSMADSLQAARGDLERKVLEKSEELQRAQRQLLQAAKLASIGELAGGVAHELNNPASTILMRSERLAKEAANHHLSAEGREDVEVIQRQVRKMSQIVSGLVSFSRQANAVFKPTDLNAVVRRVGRLMEGPSRSRGIDVVLDLEPGLPAVAADGALLEQVLVNLANNALDAMRPGGRLTLGRSCCVSDPLKGRLSSIWVEDTGAGIPRENLSRIFDPFFTTKEPGGGTGLGLSISYGIVQQHGGSIEVEGVGSDLRSAKKSWDPNSGHECTLGVSTYAQTRKEVPDGKYAGSERVCDEIAEKYPPVGESVAVGARRTGCISSGGGRTSSRFG